MLNVESTTEWIGRGLLRGRRAVDAILSFVWPPQCPLCLSNLGSIDEQCTCIHFPPGGVRQNAFQNPESDPYLAGIPLVFGAELRGPVKDLIHIFKYQGLATARELLAKRLAIQIGCSLSMEKFGEDLIDRMIVVPVPPHSTRVRERGWDHAGELATSVARRLNLPLRRLLRRRRWTPSLTKLGEGERAGVVAGAFAPTRCAHRYYHRYQGRSILLIDDVFTTGATMAACAKALKPFKPKVVLVAVAAWTPRRITS